VNVRISQKTRVTTVHQSTQQTQTTKLVLPLTCIQHIHHLLAFTVTLQHSTIIITKWWGSRHIEKRTKVHKTNNRSIDQSFVY